MSEVSCRSFSYFTAAEQRGWISVDALVDGLPVTRAFLEDKSNRVSWELWAKLCDRFGEMLGSPQAVINSGELVRDEGFRGYIARLTTLFTGPRDLYALGMRFAAPGLFHSHRFHVVNAGGGRLRITAELLAGYRDCETWFLMFQGAIGLIPEFVGLQPSLVETVEVTPRMITVLVTPPPSRSVASRARSLVQALRSPSTVMREMTFQHDQLRRTLNALRRAEGGFREALDSLPALVALHENGRVLFANRAFCRAAGRDDVLGLELTALFDDADRAMVTELLESPGKFDDPIELGLSRSDGTHISIEASGIDRFDFADRVAQGLVAIDITERIQVQRKLDVSEEMNELLAHSLPELFVRVHANGTILGSFAGASVPEASSVAKLTGLNVRLAAELVPRAGRHHIENAIAMLQSALETGEEQQFEFEAVEPEHRVYSCRVLPLESGKEVLFIINDATAERHKARQLAISERMASLGTLAAGVAHEINNPLTYVTLHQGEVLDALDRAEHGEALDLDRLRQQLREAMEGTQRVQEIVRSLRTFSRIEESAPSPVLVEPAIDAAIRMTVNEIRHRGRLVRRYDNAAPAIADEARLTQVLINLLVNAAHAIGDGAPDHSEIVVHTHSDDASVYIEVSDNGAGIPAEVLPQIFDPFYTTKPGGKGTGLGLSLAHRTIEELGGELTVDSRLGHGSTFVIRLPRSSEPVRIPVHTREAAKPPPSQHARVLVVDDEPLVGSAISQCLRSHDVKFVTNGDEATDWLSDHGADVILCDLMMPGTTGMDVYDRATRHDPALAERFVFLSGGAFTDRARTFLDEFDGVVLGKPIRSAEIRRAVARVVEAHGVRAQG